MSETGAPPRSLLVVAAVLATALAATVAVLGLVLSPGESERSEPERDGSGDDSTGPLALVTIPAPDADSAACRDLVGAAPERLKSSGEQLSRRELAEPAPPATLAWGGDPIVLRCGLDRPPELTRSSTLRAIDEVQWLPVPGDGSTTWYAVDREVNVALTVPDTAGTGPLQTVSRTIADVLPAVPLDFE